MKIIKIKQNIKLTDIDSLYPVLYGSVKKAEKINIVIPRSLTKNFFSITSSLIQFIATWLRTDHANSLIIDIDSCEEDTLLKLYEQEFIFPIIALAWNEVPIENNKNKNIRPFLRDYQNDFIRRMRKIEAMRKGEKMLLANLDHFDNATGLLPYFETLDSFVINEQDLNDSLKNPILNNILKLNSSSRKGFLEVYDEITGVIYELMKNTYEWGKDDEFNIPVSPSIRGVFIKFYKKPRTNLLEEYQNEKALVDYFKSDKVLISNDLDQIYFIEVSVFDTGVGFIKKYNNARSENLTDIDIIKKCLIKNQTSSTGILKNEKGLGLDRILQILDGKGFLRIRTDKYCLYRNLIAKPYKEIEKGKIDQMELFDWNKNSGDNFSELDYCSGSNISILFPLPQI